MYKVSYLPIANADIAGIIDYIAVNLSNVTAAGSFLDELDRVQNMIADNPFTFRVYDRLDNEAEKVRVAPVKNYYLFYSIREGAVTVKRVIYNRRNISGRWDD
ncbi:MAG: type II toxin-antitoxin system RelE/ParE family toxin [Clostridiales Family XIII bacterium]|jgi:plasmid stabilization system protein ParE|nr:type II toxin-antitoxin system RelE/ParE family toxin [Clostridiales Family XIII bacterium]